MSIHQVRRGYVAHGFLENETELIQCLYQALDNRAGFQDFLAMLVRSVSGCAAEISFIRRAPLVIDHMWHAGLSDEFVAWYLDNNMIAHDAVTRHAIHQSPGNFGSALPLLSDGEPGDQYGRWESDQDMLDSAWLVVDATDSHIVLLTVQRTVAQGPYSPEELQQLDRLIPFVRQAVRLSESLHQRPGPMQTLASIIDLVPDAAFILNSHGMLALSNAPGNQLLRTETCLSVQDRRFQFSDERVQKLFFRTVTRVAQAALPDVDGVPETLFVHRADALPLMLSIRPLGHRDLMAGGVLVTASDPSFRSFPDAGTIARYFRLSPAEAQLCEDLVTGMCLREIAQKRHKSEATMRSYLKQVFQKTGYSRQGQLISGILSSLLL